MTDNQALEFLVFSEQSATTNLTKSELVKENKKLKVRLGLKSVDVVPEWLYNTLTLSPWCGDIPTRASLAFVMWVSNALCCVFHLILAGVTVVAATQNGKGMDTPRLTVFVTKLVWQDDSANALVPQNVKSGEGLLLAHMTLWFFLLSALAHGIVVVGNYRQGIFGADDEDARKVTRFGGWYYVWIHECRQPLRRVPRNIRTRTSVCTSHTLGC